MPNTLTTDGYKFSMAQAGFPLRPETFYLSFRRGGWQYIPYDLEAAVAEMLPDRNAFRVERKFLNQHGYGLSSAMEEALEQGVRVRAAPAKSWVYEREPILTVSGPSFLVSWLEPLILRLFFPIQLATELKRHGTQIPSEMLMATCNEQAEIMKRVIEAVCPDESAVLADKIDIREKKYYESVKRSASSLLSVVEDPTRIFEVGMRAATCSEQHQRVLLALQELGIAATSNVRFAEAFNMKPVGTMGHEHVQRWGNDLDAYRAMRDMRVGTPSYLLDTFHTITSGIPMAIKVMQEREHECSVRYDSGDKFGQYIYAHDAFKNLGLEPTHILEDGLDVHATAQFEDLRKHTRLAANKQLYGYGGFLVSRHWSNPLSRDRVAAVYKLTETSGEPRMKFGNEAGLGKVSVPGHPVIWRRLRGRATASIIGQLNEPVPEDYVVLNGNPEASDKLQLCNVNPVGEEPAYRLSPETVRLVGEFKKNLRR